MVCIFPTRIFKMKKFLIVFILFVSLLLSGCSGNQVSPNENEIIFSFPETYLQYLPYDEVPDYHFTFSGIVNTIDTATTTNKKVFGKNDDFVVSALLSDLFDYYENNNRFETRLLLTQQAFETRMNRLVLNDDGEFVQKSQILRVEEGMIFEEIAYILLENGLTLTFEYRRFATKINEVLTMMFCWKYTTPLNAVLHYPIIIQKNNDEDTILYIVPLPLKSVYRLGLNDKIPLPTFVEKEEFLKPIYSHFYYPDFNEDPRADVVFDLEDNVEQVKDYYLTYHQGYLEGEFVFFTYLNVKFKVVFHEEDFEIVWVENLFV